MADDDSISRNRTPLLRSIKDAEKKFLSGRRSSADELESVVRVFSKCFAGLRNSISPVVALPSSDRPDFPQIILITRWGASLGGCWLRPDLLL